MLSHLWASAEPRISVELMFEQLSPELMLLVLGGTYVPSRTFRLPAMLRLPGDSLAPCG